MDISSNMTYGIVNGSPQVRPLLVAAAMAMITARTEETYQLVAFSQTIAPVRLSAQMQTQEVCKALAELTRQVCVSIYSLLFTSIRVELYHHSVESTNFTLLCLIPSVE